MDKYKLVLYLLGGEPDGVPEVLQLLVGDRTVLEIRYKLDIKLDR